MMAHRLYALIFDEKVENIFVCEDYELANQLARATYGNNAFAVDCNQYYCSIGDKYVNGAFYHKNERGEYAEVPYEPTEEQHIKMLNNEMDEMREYVVELDYQNAILSLGL